MADKNMSDQRMQNWLNARKVGEVRKLARTEGMPYVYEAKKSELINWLVTYAPGAVQRHRDEYLSPEASRIRQDAEAKANLETDWCQGQTNAQIFGASYASSSWGCERRPSKKEGDDPRYCWQHQPKKESK